jgi:hypothetical protein
VGCWSRLGEATEENECSKDADQNILSGFHSSSPKAYSAVILSWSSGQLIDIAHGREIVAPRVKPRLRASFRQARQADFAQGEDSPGYAGLTTCPPPRSNSM